MQVRRGRSDQVDARQTGTNSFVDRRRHRMRLPAPLDYRDVIETLKGWGVVRGGINVQ
jgi:hypothetical protein